MDAGMKTTLPPIANNNLSQIFFALLPDSSTGQNIGKKEKLSEIQDLLRYGVDVNAEIQPGLSPLCKSIKEGGSKILIELLIHYGARVEQSPPGFEWVDSDGKIIRNQAYAMAKQRYTASKGKDKDSLEILQLIQRHLIQKHLQMPADGALEDLNILASMGVVNPVTSASATSSMSSVGAMNLVSAVNSMNPPSSVNSMGPMNSVGSVSPVSSSTMNPTGTMNLTMGPAGTINPTIPVNPMNLTSSINSLNHSSPDSNITPGIAFANLAHFTSHSNVAPLPFSGMVIKKKIFVFDFDNTLVNEHFHKILKGMGVSYGHASPDLLEFLLMKYGIKNKEILYNVFKDILENDDCICIASNSRYPETIYATLAALELSPAELKQIYYVPPDLNTVPDLTIGKNFDILRAMLHFQIIDLNSIYLIDHDRTNLQIAKVKLNIPESNLIKVEIGKNTVPHHLLQIQAILKKSRVIKEPKLNSVQPVASSVQTAAAVVSSGVQQPASQAQPISSPTQTRAAAPSSSLASSPHSAAVTNLSNSSPLSSSSPLTKTSHVETTARFA